MSWSKNQAHWYAAFIIIKQSLLALSVQSTVNCPVHKQNCQDRSLLKQRLHKLSHYTKHLGNLVMS